MSKLALYGAAVVMLGLAYYNFWSIRNRRPWNYKKEMGHWSLKDDFGYSPYATTINLIIGSAFIGCGLFILIATALGFLK